MAENTDIDITNENPDEEQENRCRQELCAKLFAGSG